MMRFVSAVLPCEWKVSRLNLQRKCQYHPHRDLGANKECWKKDTETMKGRKIKWSWTGEIIFIVKYLYN